MLQKDQRGPTTTGITNVNYKKSTQTTTTKDKRGGHKKNTTERKTPLS